MNRKLLFSLVLWVMAAFVPAMAQNPLTVYDGGNINQYVPIYGYYCDSYLKCEFVIPATDLADLNGQQITELTWYLSTKPTKAWGNFTVFIKEVAETTISEYSGLENATVVYEGALDASGENFVIEFQAPYVYNGGNLLIGVYHQKGAYSTSAFYGTNVTGACVQGYSYSSLDDVTATQRNFIPKTTFAYSPAGSSIYIKPTNLAVSNIGPNEATLTWTAGSTETAWNVEYKKTTDTEWISAGTANATTFVLEDLANGYDYEARVQGNYGDGVSNWVNISFSTPLCAPEDQGEISYTLGDHYADSWNGASIEVYSVTTGTLIKTITMGTGSSTVTGTLPLCYGEAYNFVWVSGSYDNECSYTFTDPDGNVIIEHAEGDEFIGYDLATYTMISNTSTEGIEELYMVGTFNGWNQTEEGGRIPFELTDGEFIATADLEAGAEFKLITPIEGATSAESAWRWFGGIDENGVGYFLINEDLLGVGIDLVEGSNFRIEEAGNYTISVFEAPRGVQEPLQMTVTKIIPTAITDINSDSSNNTWYNIQGMKFQGVPTVPGIYINNGRKVVVK